MTIKKYYNLVNGGKTVTIIGDPDSVANFFPAATEQPPSVPVQATIAFKGGTFRKYPGGPIHNRSAGSRFVVLEKPSSGNTLPGRPFTCEVRTVSGTGKPITRSYQLTLVGSFSVLKNAARAGATLDFTLRSPNGKPVLIDAD